MKKSTRDTKIIPAQATHPGVLIKDEIDATPELTQKALAKELDLKPSFLNEIIKGKRPITADLAILLEKSLGISADYWMKFQSQYEIDKARVKEKNIKKLRNIELWQIIKKYVPVQYYRKHGYLRDDIGEDISTLKLIYDIEHLDELVTSFIRVKHAYTSKSVKLKIDYKNMLAWKTLAEYEAKNQKSYTFNYDNLPQLVNELKYILDEDKSTIKKVKSLLNRFGIKFIVINKLKDTPIEAYSFWSGSNPAIAINSTNLGIDNFAYSLVHALGHINLHIRNDRNKKFLELSKEQNPDNSEKEANRFARESLATWRN